jgi:hypothetical protein
MITLLYEYLPKQKISIKHQERRLVEKKDGR